MTKDNKSNSKLNNRNRAIIALLSVLLVLSSLVFVLRDNFVSPIRAYIFLKEAKVFENISELTKETIRQNLPDKVKNNFIEKAIIERLMDFVITPQNVSKIAEPGIKAFYKVSQKGAKLAEDRISFNTKPIKSQAQQYIPTLGLPQAFVDASNVFVSSSPDEITILDPQKNPNSPLAIFVKLKNVYRALNTTADILSGLIVVSLLLLIVINRKSPKLIAKGISWGFGMASGIVLALSLAAPAIISILFGVGENITEQSINNLVTGTVSHFAELVRNYSWVYIAVSFIAYILYLLVSSQRISDLYKETKNKYFSNSKK